MKKTLFILLITLLSNVIAFAQQTENEDPVGKSFFAPELVMKNQQAINLTEAQQTSIQKEMQSAQSEFINLQWMLQKEMGKFKLLIGKERPDETAVSEQLKNMLAVENKIKVRQLTLLTRIKNLLSHEQQEKLQRLRQ